MAREPAGGGHLPMQIPKELKTRLGREFRYVGDQMAMIEADPFDQIYLFSAVYAEIQRALNRSWSSELALLHQVAQDTHRQINTRLQVSTGGPPDQRVPQRRPSGAAGRAAGLRAARGVHGRDGRADGGRRREPGGRLLRHRREGGCRHPEAAPRCGARKAASAASFKVRPSGRPTSIPRASSPGSSTRNR